MKEEVNFDPTKTEQLATFLNINDKKDKNGYDGLEWPIEGYVPWIVDQVEEIIDTALGTDKLTSV